jgi:sulfite reductase (NADPH) flavoprotein alpha-component
MNRTNLEIPGEGAVLEMGAARARDMIRQLRQLGFGESEVRLWLHGFLSEMYGEFRALPKPVEEAAPSASTRRSVPAEEHSALLTARVLSTQLWNEDSTHRYLSVELDIEGLSIDYAPGHCVALHPTNDPDLVRELLRVLRLNAQTRVRTTRGLEPLWQVLLERLNLCHAPQALYDAMAPYARNQDELASLLALSPEQSGQSRSVGALLRRFPQLRPPVEEVLASLKPLQPALAPIASSPSEGRISILLDLDEEECAGGPGSTLAKRCVPGQWLSFTLERPVTFPFLDDDLTALVVVSDAWGMAHSRSLLVHRQLAQHRGRNWLIALGTSEATLPYAADLHAHQRPASSVRLDVLHSLAECGRDAHLLEVEETLWRWIVDRSVLVVCVWDTERQDEVRAWLATILMRRGRLDTAAAHARIESMKSQGLLLVVPEMLSTRAVGDLEPEAPFIVHSRTTQQPML